MNTKRLIKLNNKLLRQYKTSYNYMHHIRKFLEVLLLDSIYLFFSGLAYLFDLLTEVILFTRDNCWWFIPMLGWIIYEVLY